MGLIVHKEVEKNSELNDRIATDLRRRAMESSKESDLDLVEDSDYAKNLKKTGKFSWVWFVLIGLTLASLVMIVVL